MTTSTRGRPSSAERDQRRAAKPAIAVEAGFCAHQRQRLSQRAAFGFQIVGAPQHHGDGFGEGVAICHVAGDQPLGLARAVGHREGAGQAERIEAVQIAARGQHVRRAQQIASRCGTHIMAIEGAQNARRLGVLA